jgi:ribonuclease P protein component
VRRIFRESFRLSYPELPRGVDIVMIPAAPKLDPKLVNVQRELVALSRRALEKRAARIAAGGGAPRAQGGRP